MSLLQSRSFSSAMVAPNSLDLILNSINLALQISGALTSPNDPIMPPPVAKEIEKRTTPQRRDGLAMSGPPEARLGGLGALSYDIV